MATTGNKNTYVKLLGTLSLTAIFFFKLVFVFNLFESLFFYQYVCFHINYMWVFFDYEEFSYDFCSISIF